MIPLPFDISGVSPAAQTGSWIIACPAANTITTEMTRHERDSSFIKTSNRVVGCGVTEGSFTQPKYSGIVFSRTTRLSGVPESLVLVADAFIQPLGEL